MTRRRTRPPCCKAMAVHPESILWILLALYVLVVYPSFSSLSVFLGSLVVTTLQQPSTITATHYYWRNNDKKCCMDIVLVPVLLQFMALYDSKWSLYTTLASFLWITEMAASCWSIICSSSSPAAVLVMLIIIIIIIIAAAFMTTDETQRTEALLIILVWVTLYTSIQYYPSLYRVFTKSEWKLVVSLLTIAVTEWILMLFTSQTTMTFPPAEHVLVALSGVIGCGLACSITTKIQNTWIRGMLLVLVPLLTVEAVLWWCWAWQHDAIMFPRAITWLWNFLLEIDQSSVPTSILQFVSTWQRGTWLFYWGGILIFAFLCSPQPKNASVVVVRKWFHLIAICLFLPVTIVAPQFMSLSYAIALAVLAILENMRQFLPIQCQEFYLQYLDPQKDHQDNLIISHMALILGCAMPLWMYECIAASMNSETLMTSGVSSLLLLPLFGILVLGVGDSLGALVGTKFGKTKWPFANVSRTLEGSAAMWMGMAACCVLLGIPVRAWVPAVTFTTLLEAVTTQIDNLVLPLAGAAVLLLTSS